MAISIRYRHLRGSFATVTAAFNSFQQLSRAQDSILYYSDDVPSSNHLAAPSSAKALARYRSRCSRPSVQHPAYSRTYTAGTSSWSSFQKERNHLVAASWDCRCPVGSGLGLCTHSLTVQLCVREAGRSRQGAIGTDERDVHYAIQDVNGRSGDSPPFTFSS